MEISTFDNVVGEDELNQSKYIFNDISMINLRVIRPKYYNLSLLSTK